MRNCKCGSAFGKFFQRALNNAFAFVVKRACGFVENKYRRIFKEYACYGNTLLLTTRKFYTAFTYIGIITVGKGTYKFVGSCKASGFINFFFCCTGFAVFYILLNTAREKINVLLNYTYIFSQGTHCYFAYIFTVYGDFTAFDIVKPRY